MFGEESRIRRRRPEAASAAMSVIIVVCLVAAVGLALALKGSRKPEREKAAVDPAAETRRAAEAVKAPAQAPAKSAIPKLLDLGAGKCIPCKLMAPILEALRKDFAGKLEVVFVDVWENPDAAKKYDIGLIPTQIFYDPSGKELFRHEGFYSREDILAKWKELGFALAAAAPPIVRDDPLVKDDRPAGERCSLCDGDARPESSVIADAPEGKVHLCSPHCFFVYLTSHRNPESLSGKVRVSDGAGGGDLQAETASFLYGTDAKGRPTIRAFSTEDAAVAVRAEVGGEVLSWAALRTREEAVRCGFCDRATYPVESPTVKVDGVRMYACCPMCGLGVAARMRKDIELEVKDGLTSEPIRVKTLDGRVASLEPPSSVAWFGQRKGPDGKMVSAGCFKQFWFASEENLKSWLAKHPRATGKRVTIQEGLADKMRLTPEQIKNACKIGECAPEASPEGKTEGDPQGKP